MYYVEADGPPTEYNLAAIDMKGLRFKHVAGGAGHDRGEYRFFAPSPSPDGLYIAFGSDLNSPTGQSDIYMLNLEDGSIVDITNTSTYDERLPSWFPDGGKLAFVSNETRAWEIYSLDLASGQRRSLTNEPAPLNSWPTVSPSGEEIAYFCEAYNPSFARICVLGLKTGTHRLLGDGYFAETSKMDWSPDGSSLAFTAITDRFALDIVLVDSATGEIREPWRLPGLQRSPSWSPDGGYVVFSANCDDSADLFVSDRSGQSVMRLTESPTRELQPAWAPTFIGD